MKEVAGIEMGRKQGLRRPCTKMVSDAEQARLGQMPFSCDMGQMPKSVMRLGEGRPVQGGGHMMARGGKV